MSELPSAGTRNLIAGHPGRTADARSAALRLFVPEDGDAPAWRRSCCPWPPTRPRRTWSASRRSGSCRSPICKGEFAAEVRAALIRLAAEDADDDVRNAAGSTVFDLAGAEDDLPRMRELIAAEPEELSGRTSKRPCVCSWTGRIVTALRISGVDRRPIPCAWSSPAAPSTTSGGSPPTCRWRPRLLLVKADGSVSIHADDRAYKPLNWMTPPCTPRGAGDESGIVDGHQQGRRAAGHHDRGGAARLRARARRRPRPAEGRRRGAPAGAARRPDRDARRRLDAGPPRVPDRHRPGRHPLPRRRRRRRSRSRSSGAARSTASSS